MTQLRSEHAGIVIIHQELALIPELSIAENMFIGNENAKSGVIDWVATNNKARELLARVGLREDPETPIKNIGVGKQQLVEIAKALNKDVKLLILDEPTAALNEEDSQHLLDLIRGLRSKGITCVIISHKLNEIEAIANSITIIRDGQTVETLDVDAGGVNEDRIIKGMVGRSLESRFPEHTPKIGEKFFEISGWTVRHPQVPERLVCKGSNFFVRQGEIVGFAGYSTINKDTRNLVKATIEMVQALQKGTEPTVNDTKSYDNGVKVVPANLLEPVIVTKENAAEAYANDPNLEPLTK